MAVALAIFQKHLVMSFSEELPPPETTTQQQQQQQWGYRLRIVTLLRGNKDEQINDDGNVDFNDKGQQGEGDDESVDDNEKQYI
mmetsp:Transcript_33978/g.50091  ORF Transcript_33978/g.50091 Transcript_33978/m.50091 type:complete len:84 (+) Transcript_33978:262-513(+)|eukprot:scaffold17574_cov68-Skeletonema_dohrnii-CCMP3373.AAC.1